MCGCPRVGRGAAVGLKAPGIADADGASVMPLAMCPGLALGTPALYRAVKADEIVIADAAPSLPAVEAVDLRGRHVAAPGRGRAVDNDFRGFLA